MKLLVDIDDKVYGLLKYFEKGLRLDDKKDDDVKTVLMREVLNGTPLNNLTADLESLREPTEPHLVDYRYHRNDMLDAVLSVIERYKGVNE